MTDDIAIRVYFRAESGLVADGQRYDLSDFGGFLPAIGDQVLQPGVLQGIDRSQRKSRTVWTVVGRIFNPKDSPNHVCLIVEPRLGTEGDPWI
ncbi:hypothetical protein CN140_35830 [Sinorhizobium meliloti]|uniref:hypothetical protein n=1 Tax=Rhizobium meliloti TaxID=382 RepID=UPI0009B5D6A7|nr:hypothetical protein [Sinorhizobium meliloti]RVL69854.1 hypothetical protein CN140_35830 [Sinorhizobium meliloti]